MKKAAVLLSFLGFAWAALAAQPENAQRSFDVEAQGAAGALVEFGRQARLQLLFSEDEVREVQTHAVKGSFEIYQALQLLLDGTPLRFEKVGEDVVSILREEEASAPEAAMNGEGAPGYRVAQAEVPRGTEGAAPMSEAKPGEAQLEEIVVTGTHLRGSSTPPGSKLTVIDRDDIERSGYATVQDVLKTLPQNFAGGVSEDNTPDPRSSNLNYGTAINLRGLGADSTLVLVNGRRQSAGGFAASFVDVSSIAVSAIERIEVLPDGASAIYGSDAVGGVVNIILREDFQGAESRARLGTYAGDATETQISQLFGTTWSGGHALLGYQYLEREALDKKDRAYTASDDLRRFGGSDFRIIDSNPGNILDPFTFEPAFAIPNSQDGTALDPGSLIPVGPDGAGANYHSFSEQADLLPEQRSHIAFFNASQQLTDRMQLSFEGRFGTRDTEARQSGVEAGGISPFHLTVTPINPYFVDPFGGSSAVFVAYNFVDDLGPITSATRTDTYSGTLGLAADLTPAWRLSIDGTYAKETARNRSRNQVNLDALDEALGNFPGIDNPATAYNPLTDGFFNPFGDGSNSNSVIQDAIRDTDSDRSKSTLKVGSLLAEGPAFTLPAGTVRAAVGADYRQESLDTTFIFTVPSQRHVTAAFAEFAVPLTASADPAQKAGRVELSVAGRFEDYSDFGTTVDPKIGLSWAATDVLTLRGTWGTSFKAPKLVDTLDAPGVGGNIAFVFPIPDWQSPSGDSLALFLGGGNSQLNPETATTFTAGGDFKIPASFSASLTYFDIDYRDRIAVGGPSNQFATLFLPETEQTWASLITRDPDATQLESICNGPLFLDFGTGACEASTVILDFRLRNLAKVRIHGFDFGASQPLETAHGHFNFGLNGSYVLSYDRAINDNAPQIDIVDTVGNVPRLRLRGAASWALRGFSAEATANYIGAYVDNLNGPRRGIDAYATYDLGLRYRIDRDNGWASDLDVALNAVNVFNQSPPFVNARFFGYDTANADLYGRILSATVKKSW